MEKCDRECDHIPTNKVLSLVGWKFLFFVWKRCIFSTLVLLLGRIWNGYNRMCYSTINALNSCHGGHFKTLTELPLMKVLTLHKPGRVKTATSDVSTFSKMLINSEKHKSAKSNLFLSDSPLHERKELRFRLHFSLALPPSLYLPV